MNEPTAEVRLRTRPLHGDDVSLGDDRWRPLPGGPLGGPGAGTYLQPPGTYTVTLRVGDATHTQQLEVRKDPHSEGTMADIELQIAALADIRADLEATGELINRVEWVRRQVLDARAVLEDRGDAAELVAAADSLEPAPDRGRGRALPDARHGHGAGRHSLSHAPY